MFYPSAPVYTGSSDSEEHEELKRISAALSLDESLDSGISVGSPAPSSPNGSCVHSPVPTPTPGALSPRGPQEALWLSHQGVQKPQWPAKTRPVTPKWLGGVQGWITGNYHRNKLTESPKEEVKADVDAFEDPMVIEVPPTQEAGQPITDQLIPREPVDYQDMVTLSKPTREIKIIRKPSAFRLYRPLSAFSANRYTREDPPVDDAVLLRATARETKIVSTVFEITGAGINMLMQDLREELEIWFREQGSLVVCSEVVWSVPGRHRNVANEVELKDQLHRSLRANNRRVLDLKFKDPSKAPVCLPESKTEENSSRDKELGSYKGIYRRSYSSLLPYSHHQASDRHADFWSLNPDQLSPNPEKFLMGNRRSKQELHRSCLIAVSLIALKL